MAAADQGGTLALEELLRAYWYPLYAFARRSGMSVHDAQDLTQSFLIYVLERNMIAKADKNLGRFRSFLLGTMKNFMANEYRTENAQKRGGNCTIISFDKQQGEERYQFEAVKNISPAQQFDRSWALALLDHVLDRLRTEFINTGRLELFNLIEPRLTASQEGESYAAIAEKIGITENSVAVTLHRSRQRYGELLRQEIADTVADPAAIEEELNYLMRSISN